VKIFFQAFVYWALDGGKLATARCSSLYTRDWTISLCIGWWRRSRAHRNDLESQATYFMCCESKSFTLPF